MLSLSSRNESEGAVERTGARRAERSASASRAAVAHSPWFSPTAWAARHGIHYGWVIVVVTFVTVLAAAGVRAAPAVLIRPLERDFAWTRGEISLALSLSMVMYGFGGPIAGRLTDRYGLRGTTLLFVAITAVGTTLSIFLAHLWQLNVFWGLIVGLGTGGTATVMSATVANIWFESRRGLITGLLGGASSAGQLVFLPLLVWLVSALSWRA